MSKISTYEVTPVPKLADKLIGTSVGGEIEDITYNFTLSELLNLFIPNIPANTLQGILDYGNEATQDIILNGTIFTTYLEVTDSATILNSYLTGEIHLLGGLYDSLDSIGTAGQVLVSTGNGVEWYSIPTIIPDLQQVLTSGNTADVDILLDANLDALTVSANNVVSNTSLSVNGVLEDKDGLAGTAGQILSSTGAGVQWTALPNYTATSPLHIDSITRIISIQKSGSTQDGYLSSTDWITFDGKQNAGNYIISLIGEAIGIGPGAAYVTLNTASVTGKLLTGLNLTAGGNISATDSILQAFGKVQNQISSTLSGVIYKGVWDASTNIPTLASSVGVQGWYYVVNVAGNTNLNGITDWQVGDWAIFNGTAWNKVDNTDAVSSVNGQVGAVNLTTDNIPEGATNLYFLNSRARAALSFTAGSGAYNNTTGVITIPTDNNQITNGSNYITLGSLSASSPLSYNNLTGAFAIQVANTTQGGYLSSTDWNTFNNKQAYLSGTGLVKSVAGTISYITDNSTNWNTAYDNMIVSAVVTGTATKLLTLNQQDGGTITASWSDIDTGLTSVGVSMPSAFSVTNSPLTANGTIAITGAGTATQYIRGDGQLATFPSTGAGGSAVYYYLNGSINASVATYKQMANVAVIGAGTNFNLTGNGLIAQFLTDVANPNRLEIPGGAWNFEMFFNMSSSGGTPQFYVELLKYDGAVFTSIASNVALPETISAGTVTDLYLTSLAVPTTTLLLTDRLVVRVYIVNNSGGRTATLHTEDNNLCQITTTFSGGISAINGLTSNNQYLAVGTSGSDFNISSTSETHTFNLPTASASSRGALSSTDWTTFNSKQPAGSYVPTSRQLTINGTAYDLSSDRSWSVGTVTSVAALTLGTTGTDLSSSVATGTTTPVITLNVPTASAANRGALSAADWATFNTKVGGVTATSPLFSSGGSTPNVTIQQSSGSQNGYLSSTDWTTFNNKQASGNYITSLTGEATASGPGAASVTLSNSAVTAKVLTGINITGGTVVDTDSILTGFGKLQNQINSLVGSTIYKGTWNASTNVPALASGVGTRGWYYIVSVAGTTNLDGITDWFIGDWAIFDGTAWQQVDNTDAVVSVNGQTGAVSLTTDNIPEGATNLYYLNSRARAALSFIAGSGAYNSTTGVITIPTNNNQITNGSSYIMLASLSGTSPIGYNNTTGVISITQAATAASGYLSSTDWNTFNNKQATLSLTTTGSSGAATLVGATLNIPNYGTALSGYLPLTGGTLTGALNGTSANFSGAGTFVANTDGALYLNGSSDATGAVVARVNSNVSGRASVIQFTDNVTYNTGFGTETNGGIGLWIGRYPTVAGTKVFSVTPSGAATFSGSVTATDNITITSSGGGYTSQDFKYGGTTRATLYWENGTQSFNYYTTGTHKFAGAATFSGALNGTSGSFTSRIGTSLSSSGSNFNNSSLYVNNTANTKGAIFGYNDSADNFYFTALEYGVSYKPLLFNTSAATISSLSGTGSRMVVADANGLLSATTTAIGNLGYVTPTTGTGINLTKNGTVIINPAGTLAALTLNLPSSPADGDFVRYTLTESVSSLSYSGGTIVKAPTIITGRTEISHAYRAATASWY